MRSIQIPYELTKITASKYAQQTYLTNKHYRYHNVPPTVHYRRYHVFFLLNYILYVCVTYSIELEGEKFF